MFVYIYCYEQKNNEKGFQFKKRLLYYHCLDKLVNMLFIYLLFYLWYIWMETGLAVLKQWINLSQQTVPGGHKNNGNFSLIKLNKYTIALQK